MIQTTYRLLDVLDPNTDTVFIQSIEGITGAWQSYGLDAPINVVNILDTCGFDTALAAFYRATTDVSTLALIIGVALCQAHLYTYTSVFPNDYNAFNLLYLCNLYLSTLGTGTERVDYCGNSLGANSAVTTAQIADLASNIQTAAGALSLAGSYPTYAMAIGNSGGYITPEQIANQVGGILISIDSSNPIIDPANADIRGISGYVSLPTSSSLASDPNYFLKLMKSLNYNLANSDVYYIGIFQPAPTSGYTPPNYSNLAAQEFATVINLAAQQVISGFGFSLNTIGSILKQAVADYNTNIENLLGSQLARYQQFSNGVWPLNNGNAQWDADGQVILNAGLNAAAADLRDPTFLSRFDTFSSGSLTEAEMVTAMQQVQADMTAARAAAAQPFLTSINNAIAAANTSTDTVNSVFRTYLL